MATTETPVTKLKLNRLTKAQYEGITPSNTELYFVKDEAIDYEDLVNTPELADVATSGEYDDLLHKPTIPTTTDNVSQGSGAALTSGGAYTNLVTSVSQPGASNQFAVTKAGTTTSITIDGVSNAVTAQKVGSVTIGNNSKPVYINNGTPTPINYTIQKSVPADAVFTDTTYNVFAGATSSSAGAAGLVKKPVAGDQNKFLKGDGNWAVVDALPSQSGQSGKYLTTNGTTASWATVDALPSQSGNSGKFLTTNGTAASWASVATVATSGDYDDLTDKPVFNGIELDKTNKSFYGVSTSAADATQKEVSISSITKLEAGQIIIVQPSITSTVANSTLKLNNFNAYPMLYGNAAITTSTDSIVWNATFPSIWLFNGTNWVFLAHGTDTNTTYSSLNQTHNAAVYKSGTGNYAITRYSLIAEKSDGTWEKITATNATHSTATTKVVNTSGFVLGQIKYYATTTVLANGALSATNVVYEKVASVDMRYSTNCGATPGWSNGEYIYLVGTIGADSLFYLDTTTWWTNALPSTNDGKVYVQIGHVVTASVAYAIALDEDHPVFYHDGTRIRQYNPADNKVNKTSTASQVYATDSSGAQTTITYASTSSASSVVQRDSNSQINIALTPTANSHAASKKYVDDTVAADYAMQIIDWTA